jgi:hypothetical protein
MSASDTLRVSIPGRVYYDALDPRATDMEKDLGLPTPSSQKRGKGITVTYEDVPRLVARSLGQYLYDRGDTLLGNTDDPDGREVCRACIKAGEKILALAPLTEAEKLARELARIRNELRNDDLKRADPKKYPYTSTLSDARREWLEQRAAEIEGA